MKVFQIGFNRCATRSLAKFFRDNGHPALHYGFKKTPAGVGIKMESNLKAGLPLMRQMERPWVFYADMEVVMPKKKGEGVFLGYEYFDNLFHYYTDSKFIFNHRPLDKWIKSRMNHGLYRGNFEYHYGEPTYFEAYQKAEDLSPEETLKVWKDHYESHSKRVRDFFNSYDRSRLLELNIENSNESLAQLIIEFLPELTWDKDIHFQKLNATKYD